MFSRFLIVLMIILFAAILIPFAVTCAKNTSSNTTQDFTLPDLTGKDISLSNFRGNKVALIVFGATWCPPCRKEVPELKEIYKKFKGSDFVLLYIYIGESKKKVESFIRDKGIPYTVLLDEKSQVASSYNVSGIPCVFLINKKGEVAFTHTGFATKDFLSKKIEELLR